MAHIAVVFALVLSATTASAVTNQICVMKETKLSSSEEVSAMSVTKTAMQQRDHIIDLLDGISRRRRLSENEDGANWVAKIGKKYSHTLVGFAATLSPDAKDMVSAQDAVEFCEADGKVHADQQTNLRANGNLQTVSKSLWNLDRISHTDPNPWVKDSKFGIRNPFGDAAEGSFDSGSLDGSGTDIYILDTGTVIVCDLWALANF